MNPEVHKELGLFERIGNDAKSRLAIASIALMGAMGIGAITHREEAAANPLPEATASDLQQDCVSEGLIRPTVKHLVLGGPKPFSHDGTKIRRWAGYYSRDAMPIECADKYQRFSSMYFKVESPKKPNVWISGLGTGYYPDDQELNIRITDEIDSLDRNYPKCAAGSRKFRAKLSVKSFIKDTETNQKIAKTTYEYPARVKGAC